MFPNESGKLPLNAKNFVWRVFLPALEEAGIIGFHWHDLRHTFASRLVMAGVDLRTVQELMGHPSYEMSLRYSHLAPAHTLQAVQRPCRPTGAAEPTQPAPAILRAPRTIMTGPHDTEAPDPTAASERAGDRGRTGDVQLGKLIEEGPEEYDPWG